MKTYKDNTGREWSTNVTVGTIRRVKDLKGVNLLGLVDDQKLLERIAEDPVLLVDVLYAVCKPQADDAGVTDEQFGEAIAGEVIDSATAALLEGISDFFPSARRQVLRKVLEKGRAFEQKLVDKVLLDLDAVDLDALTLKALGDSVSSSPVSSESTPTPGPSES